LSQWLSHGPPRVGVLMVEQQASLPHVAEACLMHRGLGHVEFFDFSPKAMDALRASYAGLKGHGYKGLSFHAPMPRPAFFPFAGVTCFFLNEDPDRRALSFRLLEETLRYAQAWNADHIVTHLTYGKTDTSDPGKALGLARNAGEIFAALSDRYGIPIHLEFAAYTRSFNKAGQFVGIVSQYEELGICVDSGHTMLGARMHGRDYLDDIRTLAPQARSLHLWNTQAKDQIHVPLHPSQSASQGWIDIEKILEIVLACNPRIPIVFEYPVTELTPDIQAGYDWVEQMVISINQIK